MANVIGCLDHRWRRIRRRLTSCCSGATGNAFAASSFKATVKNLLVRGDPYIAGLSEGSISMRGHNNGVKAFVSPDRGDQKGGTANKSSNINSNDQNDNHHHHGSGSGGSGSSEAAQEGKKGGSWAGSEGINAVWPPKFLITLTNKEKEEDFMAIKGSKLPQRPKKRAKFIQRTVNLVCPGSWLCDLTLERYEVREKKVSKKRPRGLKTMGNMNSDSE